MRRGDSRVAGLVFAYHDPAGKGEDLTPFSSSLCVPSSSFFLFFLKEQALQSGVDIHLP
jgi:hypothetical protein